jgi:hypothetical protein
MAVNYQQGKQKGKTRGQDGGTPLVMEETDDEGAREPGTADVQTGIGNDSGTVPGRKVDHTDPHDIPPPGMKRKY